MEPLRDSPTDVFLSEYKPDRKTTKISMIDTHNGTLTVIPVAENGDIGVVLSMLSVEDFNALRHMTIKLNDLFSKMEIK